MKDLRTNQVYPVHVEIYVPRKVKDELEKRGVVVTFRTKSSCWSSCLS
ncbi:MAG: hypothetical protein MjAS7_2266 [Metallosphaera javensis (ex Sakai et al. 2022)]|nr:MAG: hypothetical protein MjAS7_2266 [Metallosphaera javensis (ex Sakai et al. 2022)]